MYKGYSVLDKKWVKGNKVEKKINEKTWKEKAYIKTEKEKVEIYPETITRAVGVDNYGDFIYFGDIVKISNKKKSDFYSVENLAFTNRVRYLDLNKNCILTTIELEEIYGRNYTVVKVGNKLEGGKRYE